MVCLYVEVAPRAGSSLEMRAGLTFRGMSTAERHMKMLDKDVPGKAPQFCGGTFGSVWFDVDLTGGAENYHRTKQVRVTPVKDEETGEWNIILDNTFDETW